MSSRPPRSNAPWRGRARRIPAVLGGAVAGVLVAGPGSAQEQEPWPMAGRDPAHSATAEGPDPPYREVWASDIGLGGPVAGPVVAADVLVVVAAEGVVAVDPATGTARWEVDRSDGPAGPAAVLGELVVHASGPGPGAAVVARALGGGREVWQTPVGADVGGGLVVGDRLVYAATAAGEVVALQAETGREEWRRHLGGRRKGPRPPPRAHPPSDPPRRA